MNVQLKDITVTARDGRVSHLEQVYIRGSHVRYFIVPDMLRYEFYFRSHICFPGGSLTFLVLGTLLCSAHEVHEVEVWDLLVVGPLSSGLGARGEEDGEF